MTRDTNNSASDNQQNQEENILKIEATGQETIDVPHGKFISDAEISRDGQDLSLESGDGETVVIENYFSAFDAPVIQSPDGSILTENLVNSFLKNSDQYAQMGTLNDESPIGAVEELEGSVTITREDGSSEMATLGTPVYEGDVIETSADGAVNVLFLDETSMAVSESARMSVDNYKFDAATESGETNLSVLRGVFVYTSGLIGRDDPDDVLIETPVGSIGIRGTIIAGNIKPEGKSEITVLEGAIVISNGSSEITLSKQFETVQINGFNDNIEALGIKEAGEMKATYGSVKNVIPKLFSSINDTAKESNDPSTSDESQDIESQDDNNEALETKPEGQNKEPALEKSEPVLEQRPNAMKEATKQNNGRDNAEQKEIKQEIKEAKQEIKEYLKDKSNPLDDDHGKDYFFNRFNLFGNDKDGQNPFSQINASGNSVSSGVALNENVGDFNGDGVNDQVYTNPDAGFLNQGEFKVVDGSTNSSLIIDSGDNSSERLGTEFDLIGDINNNGQLDFIVSSQNGSNGKIYTYEIGNNSPTSSLVGTGGEKLGYSVSALGDFNGDGKSDYVIGSPGENGGQGNVQVKFDGGGFTINGPAAGANSEFGAYVEGIGDINGDGLSDLLVGSDSVNSVNGQYEAHIYHGNNASIGTASTVIQTPHEIVSGNGIGDINGDGFDDFAISLDNGTDIVTYAVYGSNSLASTIDLTDLNNPNIALRVDHDGVSGHDYTVNAVGDKDGDGFDDFQIGIVGGTQYVVHGKDNTGAVQQDDDGDNVITASSTSESLVGNVSTLNDGGHTDISMRGGNGQNEFVLGNTNFRNIDGGKGIDTISVNGNLDFTSVNFEQISQIEKFDMGSTDGLTLTEENLFNLFKSSDNGKIIIDGVTGSSLTIDSDSVTGAAASDIASALGGTHVGTTGSYEHVQVGAYNLYVDSDVTISVI